jgi:predicted outer membrane repeat protein
MINKLKLFIAVTALLLCSWTVHAAGTVYTVTSAADTDIQGTLRYIFLHSLATTSGTTVTGAVDTIRFDESLTGATIVFGSPIVIPARNFVIDGEDRHIVLSGNNTTTLFTLNANIAIAEFSNLTVTAGYNTGTGAGAVRCQGTQTGGAITFNNVRFEGNTRTSTYPNAGAISVSSSSAYPINLFIDHCTFIKNKVPGNSALNLSVTSLGGGAIYSTATGNIEISNCLFEENSSNSHGGAIVARNATITGCIFKNNSAAGSGGAVALLKVTNGASNIKLLGNTFIGNTTEGATYNSVTYNGGVFGTYQEYSGSSAEFAGNVFQDNIDSNNSAYNEFYHSHANVAVTSGGYNVFKGVSVPGAANTWTSVGTDVADIVNATNGRISVGSPAFGIIPAADASNLIAGLAFPATDIFDQASGHPDYNAGPIRATVWRACRILPSSSCFMKTNWNTTSVLP